MKTFAPKLCCTNIQYEENESLDGPTKNKKILDNILILRQVKVNGARDQLQA